MNFELFIIPAAYILDLLVGDPQTFWHPVRIIGRLIEVLERGLNKNGRHRKFLGVVLVVLVTAAAAFGVWGILQLSAAIHRFMFYAISVLLIYFGLSVKNLADEAAKIKRSLENGDIRQARDNLSMIVGRDTSELAEPEIIRATVETVAESTMDGIVAPLFYAFLGGPVLVWVYKTVNTLDSMVGYKNERFKEFGWAAAKLDGLLNFIPAKITSLLINVAMLCCGKNWRNSINWTGKFIFKGPEVNSDATEASMAGGLGIRLGGTNYYGSQAVHKPFLGDACEALSIKHIRQSMMISYVASALMIAAGWAVTGRGLL
ncbi:MAG: adenosylcobinamide-phosphate synthase CbiB [Smithellaceae bacterium]